MNKSDEHLKKRLCKVCTDYLANPAGIEIDRDEYYDLLDYAFDTADYNKAWTLVAIGKNYFPDDDCLPLKIAFLHYTQGDYEMALTFLDLARTEPVWVSTLRLMIEIKLGKTDASEGVERIIDSNRVIDADSLYNLMLIARENNLMELFRNRLPELEKKAENVNDLYFDLEGIAEECGETDFARDLLDRLIENDPMDFDAWMEMARFSFDVDADPEKTMSAVEYGLAIEPSNKKAQILRLQCQLLAADDERKIAEIMMSIGRLASEIIDDEGVMAALISIDSRYGHIDNCIERLLWDYNKKHPDDLNVLIRLLEASERRGEYEIQDFLVSQTYSSPLVDKTEDVWVEWSRLLRERSLVHASQAVMRGFYRMSGTDFAASKFKATYLETLYIAGDYNAIASLEEQIASGVGQEDYGYLQWMFLLLVWARLGQKEKFDGMALYVSEILIMRPSAVSDSVSLLSARSAYSVALQLVDLARQDRLKPALLKDIDPYQQLIDLFGGKAV